MSLFKCYMGTGFFLVPACPGYETINASRGKTIGCSIKILQFLYSKPIVTTQDVREELKISERTARDIIQEMTRIELLQEVKGYKRNRVYSFKKEGTVKKKTPGGQAKGIFLACPFFLSF